ncbi:5-carboxymethyl-2-oxo-hex-3- ene-1,7-dioate decarboxylase [Vibrio sp. JPW-9-11-11]|uniref:fumarylacetoacetate hydrolase family protein n=1 Tax=Vibrio sp. JPW-9-11-11 TaxID=1416532 RepID=UPI001593BD7F|nr:fumarylacetoacetate hydrolase family protein [Vibrio sp. JPW-9-11-11]NVD08730.1 5-carboxymethyl-2-oxo-hex-3- ene-1,7-dioate decarboxylase [Vibrio sp. JPW-9-11-11]
MNTQRQGKVVCVALNDAEQLQAMQATFEQPPYQALPSEPVLYFKPHNTWNENHQPIAYPQNGSLVVGASVVLVIGKTCCRVAATSALDYVEGAALLHDFSLPETSYYRPDIKGKCIDNSATFSEAVMLSDIGQLDQHVLTTYVNEVATQSLPLKRLERSASQLIESISHIMTLEKGDVIAIGFAGERSPVGPGDKVRSQLGELLELNDQVQGEPA